MKNFLFEIARWLIKLFNIAFVSVFVLFVIIFLIDLIYQLPILKCAITYDPIAIANTFIVYVTFIVVIGTVGLTLAGFYFQRSIAKREGEILNENMEHVLNAIVTDKEGFREKLVNKVLEHKEIKPLIQKKLDERVKIFESELTEQKKVIDKLKESIATLGDGLQNLSVSSSIDNIKFDIVDNEVKNEKL